MNHCVLVELTYSVLAHLVYHMDRRSPWMAQYESLEEAVFVTHVAPEIAGLGK